MESINHVAVNYHDNPQRLLADTYPRVLSRYENAITVRGWQFNLENNEWRLRTVITPVFPHRDSV